MFLFIETFYKATKIGQKLFANTGLTQNNVELSNFLWSLFQVNLL